MIYSIHFLLYLFIFVNVSGNTLFYLVPFEHPAHYVTLQLNVT